VSLAWRISEEPFARRHLGTFNDLKLRASYGRNGNQEGINLYDYLQLITIGRGYPYPFGAGGQDQSAFLSEWVSKDRTWETIATTNVGLDATLLSSRLNRDVRLLRQTQQRHAGARHVPACSGQHRRSQTRASSRPGASKHRLHGKGATRGLRYAARISLSDAQNKVVNYGGQDTYVLGYNIIRQGYPLNTYFGYVFDG